MTASGRNITYALAWQSAWGQAANSAATARTFQSAAGDIGPVATQPLDAEQLIGLNGGAIDPIKGPMDVSHAWQAPLCARQSGLWLHGLFGTRVSAATAGSRGGFLFAAQPSAGDTITVGSDTLEFVSGTPGAGQIEIGANLLATVANAAIVVGALSDLDAEARGQFLWIVHTTATSAGDSFATTTSAPGRIKPISATLKGGGYTKHVWKSEENTARPWATVEVAHGDVTGANAFRLIDSQMVRGLSIAKARSGRAMMTVDVLARKETPGSARTLSGSPTELAALPFSYAGGSIMADGKCLGSLDSASVSLGVDLEPGQFDACSVDADGVIGEPAVGDTSAAVSFTGRFPNQDMLDAARLLTSVAITLTYVQPATGAALWIDVPKVYFSKPGLRGQGRGSLLAEFTGAGMIDTVAGYRYAATLWSPVTAFA